jgi:hypothetical protein
MIPRRYFNPLLVLMMWLAITTSAFAQDAQVRASLKSGGPFWVGQRITIVVDLLVPGYFASAANSDIPDPEGVLLMPPDDHPSVSSTTIDDIRYSVQRHELNAWAMHDGAQSIPAITTRFAFKRQPLDKEEVTVSKASKPIPIEVNRPPGTEGMGTIISARNLSVEENWQPQPGDATVQAGTAFIRTVTFSAPNVPGMIFPPFPSDPIDGLGVYSKPQINDQSDRGTLSGSRTDSITYLAKRPGQYTIPATSFSWFDLDSGELKNVNLPAQTLNVVVNPALAAATPESIATTNDSRYRWMLVAVLLLVLSSIVVALRFAPVRSLLRRITAPFMPNHLQSLNPTEK